MPRIPFKAIGVDIEDWDIRFPYEPWVDPLNPQQVIHLAASKDAPGGELDPENVMLTNAVGTKNVIDRWPAAGIILASTCKACAPETAYGASKLIAERLVLNHGGSVARFHNVVQTQGNVFRTWEALARDGESLPVTDCERYFIDIEQALNLLLRVAELPAGRYMADPGQARTMWSMAREFFPDSPRHWIERRRGDRKNEPLHAPHEILLETDFPGILQVISPHD